MNASVRIIFALLLLANGSLYFVAQDRKDSLIKQVESIEAGKNAGKLKIFNDSLPEEKEISQLAGRLTKLGSRLNLSIPGVHYDPIKNDANGYKNMVFTLSVSGEYKNIRRFIYEIETMDKLMYIESLTLRKTSQDKDNMTIDLQVSTFFI